LPKVKRSDEDILPTQRDFYKTKRAVRLEATSPSVDPDGKCLRVMNQFYDTVL